MDKTIKPAIWTTIVIIGGYFLFPIVAGIFFFLIVIAGTWASSLTYKSGIPKNTINYKMPNEGLMVGEANLLDEDESRAYLLLNDGTSITIDKASGSIKFFHVTKYFYFIQNVNESVPECNSIEKYCIILGTEMPWIENENTRIFHHNTVLKYYYTQDIVQKIYETPLGYALTNVVWYPGFLELTSNEPNGTFATLIHINTKTGIYVKNLEPLDTINLRVGIDNKDAINLSQTQDYYNSHLRTTYLDSQIIKTNRQTIGSCGELSSCYEKIILSKDDKPFYSFTSRSGSSPLGYFDGRYYYITHDISGSTQYISVIDLSGEISKL